MTALTGGIAPALAAPRTDTEAPAVPATTTAVAPVPDTPQDKPADKTPAAPAETPVAPVETPAAPAETPVAPVTPVPTPVAPVPVESPAAVPAEMPAAPSAQKPAATPTATPRAAAVPEPAPEAPAAVPAPQAPASTTAPATTPAPAAAPSSAAPATPSSATPGATSEVAAPTTSGSSVAATPETSPPAGSETAKTGSETTVSEAADARSEVTGSAVQQAALETPQTLQAAQADIAVAKAAVPVEQKPAAAAPQEVAELVQAIELPQRNIAEPVVAAANWSNGVRQWSPDWVRYDERERPVLSNPYRDPVRVVYVYENTPRIAVIPPLASIVLEVARLAVYSFTAVVVNAINTVVDVAVGTFFGGGILPSLVDGLGAVIGLPAPIFGVSRYTDVPVQVRYSDAAYQPFLVRQVVDLGEDTQYGERKVLLDGATPAWGQWVKTAGGQQQFEVHKTQQLPGLDTPREAPLPGNYRLRLASEDAPTGGGNRTQEYLAIAGALAVALSMGCVGLSVYLGRRRVPLH